MTLSEALLTVLNNAEESLEKRLKIADKAFNSQELRLQHKELLLLQWVVNVSTKSSKLQSELVIRKWLSDSFKNLTQNDISTDDIYSIIELFKAKLEEEPISGPQQEHIIDHILQLCDNKVFQHYFKYHIEYYCQLLSLILNRIDAPSLFLIIINKPCLFPKNFLVQEGFSEHFLKILFPVFVNRASKWTDNKESNEIVQIVYKCLIQENTKQFQSFFNHIFKPEDELQDNVTLPKFVFKYLATNLCSKSTKLFFSAFTEAFKDGDMTFKFLIIFLTILQFDVSEDFNIELPFKQTSSISLSRALSIILEILEVLSTKPSHESNSVSNKTLSDFLRDILRTFIHLNLRTIAVFKIILKCISIDPLIIEPLVNDLVMFVMVGCNDTIEETYEQVVIAVLEVFSKLHRIENFVAKMIQALNKSLVKGESSDINQIYKFNGEQDIEKVTKNNNISATSIFSEDIMRYFSECLIGLASWQTINVFKTMLYHLKGSADEFYNNKFDNDEKKITFLEILGQLTTCLLNSVKIADHTVPQNVVIKFIKGLNEVEDILKTLGMAILKREHNHKTMRTFLSLAYTWAEVYLTLTYYSTDEEVRITTTIDNAYKAANFRYLHPYMEIKEWRLISQRITNFGGYPCKKLLQKLYIQKLKAMLLLEKDLNEDIPTNIVKMLQNHMDDTWRELLLDKFTVNYIVPRMDKVSLSFLAEHLIESVELWKENHLQDSVTLMNATVYLAMSKLSRLFKGGKRKLGEVQIKSFSSQVFDFCPEEVFFAQQDLDISENVQNIMQLYQTDNQPASIKNREGKLKVYFQTLKKVPCIYSHFNVQKCFVLYIFALYVDTLDCSMEVRTELEDLIIGTLQACKFPLTDIFQIETLAALILKNFPRYDILFSLTMDNVFKNENSISGIEPLVIHVINDLEQPKIIASGISILQYINKVKKSKNMEIKDKINEYKEKILTKMSELVSEETFHIEAYATCLKHYIASQNNSEILNKLLGKLNLYLEHSLSTISIDNKKGCAILFTTVLQNKAKIEDIGNDIVLKIWNSCKKIGMGEDYSHLVQLIVMLIPNEEFELLVKDLFQSNENNIQTKNYSQLIKQLKTWESILTCDVNPAKMKIWQEVLQDLVYELLYVLKSESYEEDLFKNIVHLEQSIIQAQHFMLSPPLIDMFIGTPTILMTQESVQFELAFTLSIATLDTLLKHRHAMIMDRLPVFLQQYRVLLKAITTKSDSDAAKLDVKKASDCVHLLEKLTKSLTTCKKDMGRIAVFLIADILERYEQVNLYPTVKLHLNNCIYSLISLCDHHAVSFLMRALSNASTEMFKIMYEHYKKYYMFTGKV